MMESKELRDAAREMLAKIPVEAKREIVAKSRWTCESNWMMALVFTTGEVKENLVRCLKDGADHCEVMVENVVYPQ